MAPPGRRRHGLSPAALLLALAFFFSSTASAASAVLGVDLGTEYIKAALVKPGIPLEIVLTKDSKRKETSAVAFKPLKSGPLPPGEFPERFYGSDAVALAARFPGDVYPNLKQLLGVSKEGNEVSVYNSRYPALKVEGLEGRKTVALRSDVFAAEEKPFSVEELLAMELQNVRDNAKALAGSDVSEVVFTVPPFYTVEERRALEVSARLAGLNVLNVVSDGLAVGINYAMSRTFPVVNEGGKPEVNLVYDMGAGSASATVIKFQGRTVKDIGRFNKTIQEVQVLGASWDKTLGGDALNALIIEDMISSFVELPGAKSASVTAEKVKAHGRTAAKLWKESERVRQVLSANSETQSFFESFFEDVDFRYKISRSKLEELATDYASRVEGPITHALEAAGLDLSGIDSVIVHGGASRTPFVQARLEALVDKSKIKANVNSDEAAVFGAAFKAAGLSPSFRVKEIRDSDIQGYTHGIQYMFNLKERDQKIFTPATKIGATKDLPFQMMGEFEFTIYQATPGPNGDVVKQPTLHFASGNLTKAVTELIDKEGCDRDSFNNYVQVRLSPITGEPEVTSAWVTCETEVKTGIVDGVKNFFGMGDKKDQEPLKEGESATESSSASSSKSSKSKKSSKTSSASSSSASGAADAAASEGPKKKTVRSAITYAVTQQGYEKHPRKEFKRMQDRLAAFDASDKARRSREEVLNSLEAFTYKARDYLEDESFIAASTADVRSTLEEKLSATSDWIYAEGQDADQKSLKAKLKELEDIVKPILKRKTDAVERPEAIKQFETNLADVKSAIGLVETQIKEQEEALSKSAEAASKASASSTASPSSSASADALDDLEDDAHASPSSSESAATNEPTEVPIVYTEEDLTFIRETHTNASKWLEEKQAAQKKLKESDDPAVSVKDINAEAQKLNDAVIQIMMKKARHFNYKPKQEKKPKSSKKSKKDKKAKKDDKGPTQAELEEALEKAGIKKDSIKFGHPDEILDKDGKLKTKLDLSPDATEEEINEVIKKIVDDAQVKGDAKSTGVPPHNEL
ncbi:heat shock protein 70-like protein-like protein [Bimuria novae-zelandiae CBS 107.79]|uniref:Heat shock protein 70-like protein-like protein n=1 Tax=Bimuria novae-zelandiae CBS 107.79 TaxID=1447943 RepID=A0A6A5W4T5_9PLEO|nr:heat shock protein 70-like protein-like protein [Bimuria novae-zelandiae CBS 107.79]